MKSIIFYDVSYPGCGENYIGKTERILDQRTTEHASTDKKSLMRNHLHHCQHFLNLHGMISRSDHLFTDSRSIGNKEECNSQQTFAKEASPISKS